MRSRIFRSGNRARGNKYGRGKGEGGIRMANTKMCQRHPKVLRIGELLLSIHTGLCVYSKTVTQHSKEGLKVGVNRKTRGDI